MVLTSFSCSEGAFNKEVECTGTVCDWCEH
ncbi:hypothetical protein KP509_13G031700 [Ceratopteris richardii]|nr:hypothetical protein KP509_13G031700 [Ceratopteris richardii]